MTRLRQPLPLHGLAAALCLLAAAPGPAAATRASVDDAVADFSPSANPSGPWSWGWMARIPGPFVASAGYSAPTHLDRWIGQGNVLIGFNRTLRTQVTGTAVVPPGTLFLHPGERGQYAVVRWVAGRARQVRLEAMFTRRDHSFPTTTDVHVLRDGREVFGQRLDAGRASAGFSSLLSVQPGTVLDLAVGYGANRDCFGDATGLAARVHWIDTLSAVAPPRR